MQDELVRRLKDAVGAIEREAIDLVDLDMDDHGRQKPVIAARDRDYLSALTEEAEALRALIETIEARRAGAGGTRT
jgi:hypothetical protein